MDRIQAQAALLWQRLSAPDTGATYKQAALLTWDILKETAALLWLLICLFLVAFEWFWKNSIHLGSSFRAWLAGIEQTSPDQVVSEAGRALLSAGKNSVGFTLLQAKEQLGIPLEAPPTTEAKPAALPAKVWSTHSPEPYKAPASPAASPITSPTASPTASPTVASPIMQPSSAQPSSSGSSDTSSDPSSDNDDGLA
jgi:hypothetical protein